MNTSISLHLNTSIPLHNQLVATKFYIPVASGTLVARSRLSTLLQKSLSYPLTLVSAPAGFGKTTLLAVWARSQAAEHARLAWISLDEEDNDPRLFWTYVVAALDFQQPERFRTLLTQLQLPQPPPLKHIVTTLINRLAEHEEHFVLILDDYHLIIEQEVHTTLAYLIEHTPQQLHVILATRADPPLPLPLLRTRRQALEVRTEQLGCTLEETRAFFDEVMGIQLPDETIQQIRSRTEGWLAGLQLLGLSLPQWADPLRLLEEVSGDQRYILDYLTQEVLRRQPQEVQTFLLCTSILDQLSASLCDAVMQQASSQEMLQQLERANLFVTSLDSRRQWYRYHALFAEALRHQLEQTHADLVPSLHHRASLWYAKHDQTTQATLHAFRAQEWQWAADLLEQKSRQLTAYTWGASEYEMVLLRELLEQLPLEVIGSRPRFCLSCIYLLWQVASPTMLEVWLKAIEATLNTSLTMQTREDISHPMLDPKAQQEQQNLLGDAIALRAFLQSFGENGEAVFPLCQQALPLLSSDNYYPRILVAWAQLYAYYHSSANDAEAAIRYGLQAVSLAQMSGEWTILAAIGAAARHMKEAGQLHEAQRLIQQATQLLRTQQGGLMSPGAGWSAVVHAEILRERNQLDAARRVIEEAIPLCKKSKTASSLNYKLLGYAVLLRISLSCGDLETAHAALQEFECIGKSMNQPSYLFMHSFYTTVDQIRLWLACGELDRAECWTREVDLGNHRGTPFAYERKEVACVRVLLAKKQPTLALERLKPVLQRASVGKRWGHVIEIQLLQALAYQMHQEEAKALDALSEAVRLGEPEGYIRSFVDEGASMEALLSRLRKRERESGATPYLDTLLTAFEQESKAHEQAKEPTKAQPLLEPLSERELQVLQLLARGASNQEIAQELVIALDTVKRHVSHIFSKLGAQKRIQAVRQAQELGLLSEEG